MRGAAQRVSYVPEADMWTVGDQQVALLVLPKTFRAGLDGNRAVGVGFRIVAGAELIAVDQILDRIALGIVQREAKPLTRPFARL
jgi:hypothetical protein